jgi:hypothetical protein
MTISSLTARRRYLDKSSLTFANATSRIRDSFFGELLLRGRLLEDRKDFDCCFFDVIKHPYFINSQAILRPAYATKPFDTTLADLRRFVTQVKFKSIATLAPDVR